MKIDEKDYGRIVSGNLRRIMYENGKTQADVARDLKISKATVSSWMNGTRVPRMPKIDLLCHYFNVNRSDLMEPHSAADPPTVTAIRVPILGYVAAGIPISAVTDIIDWAEVTPDKAAEYELFGLKIKGDSMYPLLYDGDYVICRAQSDAENGDICIVQVNGAEATCKKIRKRKDELELVPINPMYDPIIYTPEQVESLPVRIIGKVIESKRSY